MEPVTNPFQACNDIYFKPNRVFATLAVKDNWSWIAFFFVLLLALAPNYLYFNFVDFHWYTELVISSNFADVSPAEQDAIRDNMAPQQTILFSVIGGIVGFILINAVLAIYLNVVTKSDEENVHGFTDWYGFTWWVSLPVILSTVGSIIVIMLSTDHQLSPAEMNPTALGFILGISMDSKWFALSQAIRLDSIWTMYLIAVGVSQWTQISGNKPYIIAAAPYLTIWLVWALFTAI